MSPLPSHPTNVNILTNKPSIVGVSNQLSWICIGLASLRFRHAIRKRGMEHLLPFKNWTYPVGPVIAVGLNCVLVLVQGWQCFSPHFKVVDFVSFYIEIPVMIVMFLAWKLIKRTSFVRSADMDLVTDRFDLQDAQARPAGEGDDASRLGEMEHVHSLNRHVWNFNDEKGAWGKVKRIGMWLFL